MNTDLVMRNEASSTLKLISLNRGGIQGQDFRLDIEGEDITDDELAQYIIQDMRLLSINERPPL